jgi:hypothetical protein
MKEIFEKIIKNRFWRNVPCGSGSTVEYTTPLRQFLPDFVAKHNIASMLDLPCGDYSWMSMVDWPGNFQYQGADIVEFMISENQQRCPDINFSVMNLCQDPLPQVDLLFCRDCLFHLSFADIKQAFSNISRSKIRWVLTTTYPDVIINTDIKTGDFRPINLELHPFNLPKPVDYLVDYIPNHQARVMALWKQEDFIGKML